MNVYKCQVLRNEFDNLVKTCVKRDECNSEEVMKKILVYCQPSRYDDGEIEQ